MEVAGLSLTTITLFTPLVGFLVLLFLPGSGATDEVRQANDERIKWTAFGFSIATLLLSLLMWFNFDPANASLQLGQVNEWLSITIGDTVIRTSYYVGVDGISLLLVLLTTFIMPIAILASFSSSIFAERGRLKLYYLFMLLLQWAMIGVFVMQDLLLFYVFWEITLVPMYFLIGIWGGEQRVYASVKFFLYTMAGSLLMLVAMLYVAGHTGSFSLPEILAISQQPGFSWMNEATPAGITASLLFFGFFIAFAVKVPIFPFHSWLPDAHVQAPTAGSVILAGVLLKMGTYGLLRFNLQLFPEQSREWAPLVAVLAVIGIIYGAWVSYAQTDVKKLVAYSSVSHLGFVVLGIFALNSAGIQGATLQMVNHGITTGGLFLIVGILYERYHTKAMEAYGGLWRVMPVFGGVSLIVVLASMGLPGLNGFVGEFTILLGSLTSETLGFYFTLFATLGVILAAVYMLYMYQRVFMGDYKAPHDGTESLKLKWNEIAVMVPILVMVFWIGVQPAIFFNLMSASVNHIVVNISNTVVTVASLIP
jgi:NADH-quinone oxidoreductase subunit M